MWWIWLLWMRMHQEAGWCKPSAWNCFFLFLMDLILLLILFSIAHMLHMLLFLPMMIPRMLTTMSLNSQHTIMFDFFTFAPIPTKQWWSNQVGSNHLVCVSNICGLLNQWEPCTLKNEFYFLPIKWLIRVLHIVCDKSWLPCSSC